MTQKHLSKSIELENYQVEDNVTLTVDPGTTTRIKNLVCGEGVTVHLDNGSLIVDSGSAGANFTLSGRGTLKIISDFAITGDSSLRAENISLDLTDATLRAASGELYLDNCPVIGGEIISERVEIIAPKKHIFDRTAFTGKLVSNVAYPEWFVDGDTDNWAPAINSAFEVAGKVRLDSRVYKIKETIWIPPVGQLTGCDGGENGDGGYGTVLLPNEHTDSELNYSDNFIIKINLKKDSNTPIKEYIKTGAKVAHLEIDNKYIGNTEYSKRPLYGIKIAFNAEIDNVSFKQLKVAIKWTADYADLKKITRCSFSNMLPSDNEDEYLVDFGHLGDALIFQGNGIHGDDTGTGNHRGILIATCNSGILTSNIINADVKIRTAKGITFSNNHMEGGRQLTIEESDVTVSNNFIVKGQYPSVVIKPNPWGDSAAVNLSNNQYIYNPKSDTGICDYDIAVSGEKYTVKENNADVVKYSSPQCVINISNELRYRAPFGEIERNMMAGISIGVSMDGGETFSPAEAFNNRSQIYSRSSVITVYDGEFLISYPPVSIKGWESASVSFNSSAKAEFGLTQGNYSYYCQLILDYDSEWVTPLQSITDFSDFADNTEKKVLLFLLFGAAKLGNSVMLRMIRCEESEQENPVYADIPLVNAYAFYDDGQVVGGYNWHKASDFDSAALKGQEPPVSMFTPVGDTIIPEIKN